MEHGASERVKEQSHTEMPVKTDVDKAGKSTAYCEIQVNMNDMEEEPGLVGLVKREAALLVKEQVVGDGRQDVLELQCGPSTSAIVGSMNEFDGIGDPGNILNVKEELGAIDIGPTVLQHADAWYTTNQKDVGVVKQEHTINHKNLNPILCAGVKEEIIEDIWGADTNGQRRNKLYSCDKCGKTYSSKDSLMQHYRNLHSTESHKCTKCNKKFPLKVYLSNHTIRVHSEQEYECAVCKKVCRSKAALYNHVYYVHRPRPADSERRIHICNYCKKTFGSKSKLTAHITCVHGSGSYKCSQCNKCFKCKEYLVMHTRRTHPESHQLHTCTNCGKNFKSKLSCRQHKKRGKCKRPTAGNTSAVASTSRQQRNVVIVKEGPADGEVELGPVVFQHMDCNYRPYKEEPQLD